MEAVLAPASFGWVQLQLHYDGRRPPVGLLDDIARLGWSVPPPPTRPASAIDWYTPDPMTGERFTVLPWRAVHDIDPPGRGASRATWNAEHRAVALRALAPVLIGHQVQVSSPVPELVALATAASPDASPAWAGAAQVQAQKPSSRADEPMLVSFTAPADRLERIDGFLRSTGLPYRSVTEVHTRRQVFRGSTSEQDVMVVAGEVVVRADRSEALRGHLRDERASAQERPATAGDIARLDAARAQASPAPGPARAGGGPAGGPAAPVVLRLDLTGAPAGVVDRLVAQPALAGLGVTVAPGTRTERISYRGSASEVERPCLYVEVACPAERADLVRAALAHEAGVGADRVEIVSPDRPS